MDFYLQEFNRLINSHYWLNFNKFDVNKRIIAWDLEEESLLIITLKRVRKQQNDANIRYCVRPFEEAVVTTFRKDFISFCI